MAWVSAKDIKQAELAGREREREWKRMNEKRKKTAKKWSSIAQTTFCAKVLLDNSIQNETVQMLRSQSHCHTIHIHTLGEIDEGEQLKLLILQESSNLHKTCQLTKCSFAFFLFYLLRCCTHTHLFLPPSFNAQTQTNC